MPSPGIHALRVESPSPCKYRQRHRQPALPRRTPKATPWPELETPIESRQPQGGDLGHLDSARRPCETGPSFAGQGYVTAQLAQERDQRSADYFQKVWPALPPTCRSCIRRCLTFPASTSVDAGIPQRLRTCLHLKGGLPAETPEQVPSGEARNMQKRYCRGRRHPQPAWPPADRFQLRSRLALNRQRRRPFRDPCLSLNPRPSQSSRRSGARLDGAAPP